jgi:hypothetical protein
MGAGRSRKLLGRDVSALVVLEIYVISKKRNSNDCNNVEETYLLIQTSFQCYDVSHTVNLNPIQNKTGIKQ